MRGFIILAFAFLSMTPSATRGNAEEVSLEYLGLELSGYLETAPGKSLKSDGVVVLVHDTLGHGRMELMAALQDSLRDMGINSLAITLGLGMDKRHGMFDCSWEQDHRHEDAVEEISAWVQWLKEKGAASITLAGHGSGGKQDGVYAVKRLGTTVKRGALTAAPKSTS